MLLIIVLMCRNSALFGSVLVAALAAKLAHSAKTSAAWGKCCEAARNPRTEKLHAIFSHRLPPIRQRYVVARQRPSQLQLIEVKVAELWLTVSSEIQTVGIGMVGGGINGEIKVEGLDVVALQISNN